MQITATIADWSYGASCPEGFWDDLDETKSKSSVFTLWNDSVIMNCDFSELYVAHREKLPAQLLPALDRFLANCAPSVCELLGLKPDYDLACKLE